MAHRCHVFVCFYLALGWAHPPYKHFPSFVPSCIPSFHVWFIDCKIICFVPHPFCNFLSADFASKFSRFANDFPLGSGSNWRWEIFQWRLLVNVNDILDQQSKHLTMKEQPNLINHIRNTFGNDIGIALGELQSYNKAPHCPMWRASTSEDPKQKEAEEKQCKLNSKLNSMRSQNVNKLLKWAWAKPSCSYRNNAKKWCRIRLILLERIRRSPKINQGYQRTCS